MISPLKSAQMNEDYIFQMRDGFYKFLVKKNWEDNRNKCKKGKKWNRKIKCGLVADTGFWPNKR